MDLCFEGNEKGNMNKLGLSGRLNSPIKSLESVLIIPFGISSQE